MVVCMDSPSVLFSGSHRLGTGPALFVNLVSVKFQ